MANQVPGRSPLRVDTRSCLLRVTPDRVGLFVFSVEVGEYRNKKLIGVVRRDYQVLVIDCAKNDPPTGKYSWCRQEKDYEKDTRFTGNG